MPSVRAATFLLADFQYELADKRENQQTARLSAFRSMLPWVA
jgi:hypothetical protein